MRIIDIPPELREYLDQMDTYPELQRRDFEEGSVTCIYCGTPNLYWSRSLDNKWILCKGDQIHKCSAYRRRKL